MAHSSCNILPPSSFVCVCVCVWVGHLVTSCNNFRIMFLTSYVEKNATCLHFITIKKAMGFWTFSLLVSASCHTNTYYNWQVKFTQTFSENDPLKLLEDISLHLHHNMYYQHDGAPAHFCMCANMCLRQPFCTFVVMYCNTFGIVWTMHFWSSLLLFNPQMHNIWCWPTSNIVHLLVT